MFRSRGIFALLTPSVNSPYKFEEPWGKFEFANHVINTGARLVIISMAWITQEDPRLFSRRPNKPDMNTLTYWISRLEPIIRAELNEEVIVVFANRTGSEDEVTYAGTSAVVGIKSGEVRVYGILGRGEKELLVVDTEDPPYAKLVYRTDRDSVEVDNAEHGETDRRGSLTHLDEDIHEPSSSSSSDGRKSKEHQTNGTPSYRRDDLSVKVYQKRQFEQQFEDPSVNTPSAPSPTPQSIRPRMSSEPVNSTAQRCTTYQPPTSHHEPASAFEEPLIIDPEATARRLGLIRDASPTGSSRSDQANQSGHSSPLYYDPQDEHGNGGRHRWVDDEDVISDFESMSIGRENRHSLRSDIAVWNNESGRSRETEALPTPPQETTIQSTLRALQRVSSVSRLRDLNQSTNGSRSRHPKSSKPRSTSRNNRPGRSQSSMLPAPDLVAAYERFEEMAQRAETAQGQLISFDAEKKSLPNGNSSRDPQAGNSRQHRASQPLNQFPHLRRRLHERTHSENSIPIMMDSGETGSRSRQHARSVSREHSLKMPDSAPPILRPASRSRIDGGNAFNRGRDRESSAPIPDSTIFNERVQSARPAAQENRAISRGRTRSARVSGSQQQDSGGLHHSRRGSHRHRDTSQDIDLSQFNMIEEYPSANCPVHGSRSRSRTGHRNPSRRRTPATNRTQPPPSRQGNDSRRSTQNTPRTAVRNMPMNSKAPSRSTTDLSRTGGPVDSPGSRAKHRVNDSVGSMTFSASTVSPGQEPKTPVAMVLMSHLEEFQPQVRTAYLPPVNHVETPLGYGISRPRSVL